MSQSEPDNRLHKKQLRQLVAFVQRWMGPLSGEDLETAAREMLTFVMADRADVYINRTSERLADVIAQVRSGIAQLAAGRQWKLALPAGQLRIRAGKQIRRSFVGDLAAAFLWQSQQVVDAERIRICALKGCVRIFVPNKGQEFCSHRCSQRARNARFRQKHSPTERYDRRRRAYLEQLARENPALLRHVLRSAKSKAGQKLNESNQK